MRIVLCTSGGGAAAAVLQRLRASPRVELAAIVLSTRRGAWAHFRRSGLAYLAYLGAAVTPPPRAAGAPLIRTRDVNLEKAGLARLAPDLIVSAFFNQKIGAPLVAAARHGAVNIHPSLLPELKGVDPVFYARLRDAPGLGVSLHRVSPELDGGAILAQRSFPVEREESVLAATARLFGAGAELLLDSLDAIAAGAPGTPQPGPGSYFSWPDRAQVAALRRKGVRLV